MGYLELDVAMTDEQRAVNDMAKRFAMEVLRPIGIKLDKLADPADVIAKDSPLWEIFKKQRELDLHKAAIPKEFGGLAGERDPLTGALIAEQLGYGDAGLAISLGVCNFPFRFAAMSPEPELQQLARDYCEDDKAEMIGCWALTEPEHGSDWILAGQPGLDNPKCGPSLKAVLKGDEYIINGQKAAWVSNGTIATHAVLHVGIDASRGMAGTGIAIVPLDLPGITKGKPLDKIGQRPLNQGELYFEEVRLPKAYMFIGNPDMGTYMIQNILTGANGGMGALFVGLAQAAFDEALTYAKERMQGGVPIFEHKNIKLKLFDMFVSIEAARAYVRRMWAYNATNMPGSLHHAIAAKVLSTETAFKVTSEAISIFGGNGLSKEYPIEKMFRDARASMIEDGENSALALKAASFL
ncbi:MAG: acyl-CoA dehydrogenase [Candidatus Abyssobacteria bacterium SURF_17]|uniref:Acyl-CoA dehydrogenase n=1 Tax=Candidatus Abyssobacteria bacterium SURF_17 TaxID=2093361 RepID=A0A419F6H6_9BACT|nr:MAG: acyl-CoA dehydrogenase [Candidatus Abyssubacteria bacterium SURF_17]